MKELHTQIQDVFAAGIHEGGEDFREGGKINTVHKDGVKNSIRMTEDGIKYVKLDGNIFRRFDGTEMSQTEAYNALVGKKITLEDGDVITFIKKLPGRSVYNELFKKLPGYDPGIDVKAVSQAINRNMVEVIEASTVQTRNEPQRHPHIGIKDFDQREVYLVDGQSVYRMELCIANLTDGTKIAYVKRFIANPSADVVAKIKKAETAVQNRLNQPSNSSIRNSKPNVNKNSLRYQKNEAAQSHMAAQDASLAEDMEGLQAFVALQKKQGRQAKMETEATNAAATFLMKTAGAKGDKAELMNLLDGFYRYVASTELQSWESVREKAMPVVRWLMKNTVRTKQCSEYAQDVLNTLHGSRVSLDETQKNEVAHIYGSFGAFRNTIMGSIILPLVLAWYIVTELGSILENAVKMGAVVPEWLIKLMKIGLRAIDEAGEKIEHEAAAVVEPNEEAQPAESSEN